MRNPVLLDVPRWMTLYGLFGGGILLVAAFAALSKGYWPDQRYSPNVLSRGSGHFEFKTFFIAALGVLLVGYSAWVLLRTRKS